MVVGFGFGIFGMEDAKMKWGLGKWCFVIHITIKLDTCVFSFVILYYPPSVYTYRYPYSCNVRFTACRDVHNFAQ